MSKKGEIVNLAPVICRSCGKLTNSRSEEAINDRGSLKDALDYDSCLRKCENCEIGFSNTQHQLAIVRIYKDFKKNIPKEALGELSRDFIY